MAVGKCAGPPTTTFSTTSNMSSPSTLPAPFFIRIPSNVSMAAEECLSCGDNGVGLTINGFCDDCADVEEQAVGDLICPHCHKFFTMENGCPHSEHRRIQINLRADAGLQISDDDSDSYDGGYDTAVMAAAVEHIRPDPHECEVCKETKAPWYGMAGWLCDECFKHTQRHNSRCDETRENCCCSQVLLYVAQFQDERQRHCGGCRELYYLKKEDIGYEGDFCYECDPDEERESVCECDGSGQPCDHCQRYLDDKAEYEVWCGVDESPRCTCNRETGLMCDMCSGEYKEPCRTCGVNSHLWTDEKHCHPCFVKLYGNKFPEPTATSLAEMREEISDLQASLAYKHSDYVSDLLAHRIAELDEAIKEMWEGYDKDDLIKMDRADARFC